MTMNFQSKGSNNVLGLGVKGLKRFYFKILFTFGLLIFCAASPPSQDHSSVILHEFLRAQKTELKAVEHRNKAELKELKAAQDIKQKEWEKSERDARVKFFEENTKGPERRAYVQDFIKRREAFRKYLADQRTQMTREQQAHITAIRQEQANKLKEFKKSLENKETPSKTLWPQPGQ